MRRSVSHKIENGSRSSRCKASETAQLALATRLLVISTVSAFLFDEAMAVPPRRNHLPLIIAGVLHLVLLGFLIFVRTKPVRVSPEGSPSGGIAAYVSGPIGGTSTAAPRAEPKKTALKTEMAKNAPKDEQSDAGTAVGSAGAGRAASGPVRLGSGGNITLLKKVQPVYPGAFQSARVPGQVTLDAVIHADGTIGDITILRSTNDAFARSAIDAVKQWKYAPIGFEAILTVTVNFTLT
jgi:TonB family protein